MPYRLLTLLLAGALVLLSACGNTAPLEEEPVVTPTTVEEIDEGEPPEAGDVVSGTATVRYMDFEGGFYGLVTRQEERFLPQNLPDSLQQDGIDVRFRGEIRTDVVTIQQWGTPIELIDIARVEVLEDEDDE